MKRTLAVLLSATIALSTAAAQQTTTTRAGRETRRASYTNADIAAQLQQIRAMLEQQQQQIEQLQQQLTARDQAVQTAQQQAMEAQSAAAQAARKADAASSQATSAQQNVAALQTSVGDVKANATTTALNIQENQSRENESPVALRYKGITITPGGFLAAETVWHQHGMTSDVATPFNSIPFAGASQYHLSEFFGSGRPSRLTLLMEGKLSSAKFTGYYEMDFLSAGVTSNNNQSNSYTNRQRQVWGQAALSNGWSFTGGQMWSLVTETKSGLENRSEALPSVIDHNYHVGFSWARQYGFRITKNFNNKLWLGASIENAQTLLTAHGNQNNFVFGNAGTGGGQYNPTANYSYNVSPDYVVKLAWQPKFGHYEIIGVVSPFRDRVYPNATATPASSAGAYNDSRLGGGVAANARWLLYNKHLEFGVHAMGGDGIGRYGTSNLPDATVRPDGTLALLHSYHGLGTIEVHYPKFDVYFNGGTEYVARYWQTRAGGTAVGYGSPLFNNSGCMAEAVPAGGNGFAPGSPANCNADTKDLIEITAGFYYKFYNGPKGRIQWGPQFSHIIRNTWSGIGGSPDTNQNMVLTSFRYYLP
jgi:hypothetical protein